VSLQYSPLNCKSAGLTQSTGVFAAYTHDLVGNMAAESLVGNKGQVAFLLWLSSCSNLTYLTMLTMTMCCRCQKEPICTCKMSRGLEFSTTSPQSWTFKGTAPAECTSLLEVCMPMSTALYACRVVYRAACMQPVACMTTCKVSPRTTPSCSRTTSRFLAATGAAAISSSSRSASALIGAVTPTGWWHCSAQRHSIPRPPDSLSLKWRYTFVSACAGLRQSECCMVLSEIGQRLFQSLALSGLMPTYWSGL
jgi:hypothetical protein